MTYPTTTNSDPKELTMTCPCGTPDDANGHHVCPDLPREEVHTTSEGLATVTIYNPDGQVLGIGHGFTLSDARAQAQERARAGADELERTNALLNAEPHVTCDEIGLCNDPAHTSLDCYWRYLLLCDEPGGRIMSQAEWTEAMTTDDDTEGEDICWACDGATDEQAHTCDRYAELTPSDLEHLDSPTGTAGFQALVTEYLEANADDGDGPPSVWDFVLWTLHRR